MSGEEGDLPAADNGDEEEQEEKEDDLKPNKNDEESRENRAERRRKRRRKLRKRPAESERRGMSREEADLPAADNEEEEEEEEEEKNYLKPGKNDEEPRKSKAERRRRMRRKSRRKRPAETERLGVSGEEADLPAADNGEEEEEEEEDDDDDDNFKPDKNDEEPRESIAGRRRRRSRRQGVQTKSTSLDQEALRDLGHQIPNTRTKQDVMSPLQMRLNDGSAVCFSLSSGGPSVKRRRRSGGAPLNPRVGQDPQADSLTEDGLKSPVQKLRCPRGLKEPDFLDLLKSTFPQGPPYLRVHQCTHNAGETVQLASGNLSCPPTHAGHAASSS
ncbi:DEAD-box ATP-dependent RNA helicase 42-like [Cyclopterus lumpus]|uniref:DEAD-box ATP-dependent RNA helicase 42-like n=1 Tax=Cyclopterus lumpus TaxID=8103 RepID=UPI0014863D35|nr:DEAD-box ATP-dependent RNA helicase 42-like [Cyclopterus lumpus]